MTPQAGYTRNSAFTLRDGDITYPPSMALLFFAFALASVLPLPFVIVAWGVPIPARWWHPHEAVFGLGSGLCSGFLLTALPHWLGTKRPGRLAVGLVLGAWCAGRAGALTWAYGFQTALIFGDTVVWTALASYAIWITHRSSRVRPRKVAWILAAVAVASLKAKLDILGDNHPAAALRWGEAALGLLVLVMLGRMLPSFTFEQLNKRDLSAVRRRTDSLDHFGLLTAAVCLVSWSFWPQSVPTQVLGGVATGLNLVRLMRLRGWRCGWDPNLTPFHIAMGFFTLGLCLIAAQGIVAEASPTHAMLAGSMTLSAIAVGARMLEGHLGIRAHKRLSMAVAFVLAGIVLRLFSPFHPPVLIWAAGTWMTGFGFLTLAVYLPAIARAMNLRAAR